MGIYGDCRMTKPGKLKPIKICFVAPKAYPIFNPDEGDYFGGAEVDLYYLATELAQDENFQVSYVVADYGQPPIEIREGVTIIKTVDFKKNPICGAWRVWRGLRQADARIYMLKTASPGTPLIALFCKLKSRSFTYRTASSYECDGTYLRKHRLLGPAFAWSLRQAEILFTQSTADAKNLSATIGVSSHIIPNGHPMPELDQKKRDTILWVGRDAAEKQPRYFLELARAIPTEHFTIICQTLTNDRAYADMKAQAAQIENLQFIPHVPFNQIDSYFQRAKVFVNTSDAEGFPNTFIQACTAGTPILSLNVNPDGFLDKQQCGLCACGDWDSFVKMLDKLLEPEIARRYGANGRCYVEENHDIKKIAQQYKTIFIELIKTSK